MPTCGDTLRRNIVGLLCCRFIIAFRRAFVSDRNRRLTYIKSFIAAGGRLGNWRFAGILWGGLRNRLDLIVLVCNDGAYGAEYVQWRDKGLDPGLSVFDWPDFAPVAEALGGRGLTVRTSEDLEAAARAVAQRNGPLLIDIKLDPDHMPERTG